MHLPENDVRRLLLALARPSNRSRCLTDRGDDLAQSPRRAREVRCHSARTRAGPRTGPSRPTRRTARPGRTSRRRHRRRGAGRPRPSRGQPEPHEVAALRGDEASSRRGVAKRGGQRVPSLAVGRTKRRDVRFVGAGRRELRDREPDDQVEPAAGVEQPGAESRSTSDAGPVGQPSRSAGASVFENDPSRKTGAWPPTAQIDGGGSVANQSSR